MPWSRTALGVASSLCSNALSKVGKRPTGKVVLWSCEVPDAWAMVTRKMFTVGHVKLGLYQWSFWKSYLPRGASLGLREPSTSLAAWDQPVRERLLAGGPVVLGPLYGSSSPSPSSLSSSSSSSLTNSPSSRPKIVLSGQLIEPVIAALDGSTGPGVEPRVEFRVRWTPSTQASAWRSRAPGTLARRSHAIRWPGSVSGR